MGRIEYLVAEMRTAGMTVDDRMLYTIFIDALPAEYEVETRNLASLDSIGRDDIIKAVRERHRRLSGRMKNGSNAGHAGYAMFAGGGDCSHRKGAGGGAPTGKVEAAEKEVNVGDDKEVAVNAPTRTTVARPRLPAVMAAAPKPAMVVPPR